MQRLINLPKNDLLIKINTVTKIRHPTADARHSDIAAATELRIFPSHGAIRRLIKHPCNFCEADSNM